MSVNVSLLLALAKPGASTVGQGDIFVAIFWAAAVPLGILVYLFIRNTGGLTTLQLSSCQVHQPLLAADEHAEPPEVHTLR